MNVTISHGPGRNICLTKGEQNLPILRFKGFFFFLKEKGIKLHLRDLIAVINNSTISNK